LISGTGTPTSKDRELPLFVGSLLSRWDARYAGGGAAQPGSRVKRSAHCTGARCPCNDQPSFSNKRIARTLEISPETVKTHVKRIFLKLAVNSRTEAVCRAGSLGLLGLDSGVGTVLRETASASGPRQICPKSARPRVKSSLYWS
jgi:hypothetical protein